MKTVLLAIAIGLAGCVEAVEARMQTRDARPFASTVGNAAASSKENANTPTDKTAPKSAPSKSGNKKKNEQNKTAVTPANNSTAAANDSANASNNSASPTTTNNSAPVKVVNITPSRPPKNEVAEARPDAPTPAPVNALLLTQVYRIGVGDVLDIRLQNLNTRESTLFTILPGGLLDYPLAGNPLQVEGRTADEIREQLNEKIKAYGLPQVTVNVREYASHSVTVNGLVQLPGAKYLRREAVPLYVLVAEAQPQSEALRATITRVGGLTINADLSDQVAMSELVYPGDVVRLSSSPPPPKQFFYIGGEINAPGQRDFHDGMTLTQAILTAGGLTSTANSRVKISRQGADGLLVATEYNLKHIQDGKVPDPVLRAGDRVEVGRGRR